MRIHKVICDKCGREEEIKTTQNGFFTPDGFLPENWATIKDKDLCPDCINKFINE